MVESGRQAALARGTKMQGNPERWHRRQEVWFASVTHLLFCRLQFTKMEEHTMNIMHFSFTRSAPYAQPGERRGSGGLTAGLPRLLVDCVFHSLD
jgi:hypothetical protein